MNAMRMKELCVYDTEKGNEVHPQDDGNRSQDWRDYQLK